MSNLSDFVGGTPPVWVSGTTYPAGKVVWSPSDYQYFMRKSAGGGTTDPASDPTNWQPTGDRAIKSIQRGVGTGSATGNITISAVDTAKTELRWLGGYASSAGVFSDVPQLRLTSSTNISITAGGNSSSIAWELTERY